MESAIALKVPCRIRQFGKIPNIMQYKKSMYGQLQIAMDQARCNNLKIFHRRCNIPGTNILLVISKTHNLYTMTAYSREYLMEQHAVVTACFQRNCIAIGIITGTGLYSDEEVIYREGWDYVFRSDRVFNVDVCMIAGTQYLPVKKCFPTDFTRHQVGDVVLVTAVPNTRADDESPIPFEICSSVCESFINGFKYMVTPVIASDFVPWQRLESFGESRHIA